MPSGRRSPRDSAMRDALLIHPGPTGISLGIFSAMAEVGFPSIDGRYCLRRSISMILFRSFPA